MMDPQDWCQDPPYSSFRFTGYFGALIKRACPTPGQVLGLCRSSRVTLSHVVQASFLQHPEVLLIQMTYVISLAFSGSTLRAPASCLQKSPKEGAQEASFLHV